jgi:hypothetical protein
MESIIAGTAVSGTIATKTRLSSSWRPLDFLKSNNDKAELYLWFY